MGLSTKHYSKRVIIELIPLEIAEFNGDKLAYFLAMLQEELSDEYIAQYGKGYSTVLIYKKDASGPIPEKQLKLGVAFQSFKNKDAQFKSIALNIPKILLKTRATEHILVVIRKVSPVKSFIPFGGLFNLDTTDLRNRLLRVVDGKVEIYEYKSWNKVGIRYRSER